MMSQMMIHVMRWVPLSSMYSWMISSWQICQNISVGWKLSEEERTRSPATESRSFRTWTRGPISRYSRIASYSGYSEASDQNSSGVSTGVISSAG